MTKRKNSAVELIRENKKQVKPCHKKKTKNSTRKPAINKHNSFIGRTFVCSDNDLPHDNDDSNKIVNIATIAENNKKDLAVVRLTRKKTQNAQRFKNKHRLYKGYKTFVEIEFQGGDKINAKDKRLKENPWINDLNQKQLNEIREYNLYKAKQRQENREKINSLFDKKND